LKILAIIPARSESKGITEKNIRLLNNKPLMAYSIEAAKESEVFDKIIVSTDSQEYAEEAIKLGAEVPFLRPEELAKDTTPMFDVIQHAIESLKSKLKIMMPLCCCNPQPL
jgi:CMP-N,N'-diacetyllegionaminic acid synthase